MSKCKNCGGKLSFSPQDKGNKCNHCGSMFPIDYIYEFSKKPFSENVDLKVDEFADTLKRVSCSSCGASVFLDKYQMQNICAYCGNKSIIKNKKTKLMYIDSIIPFSFDKNEALKRFKSAVKKNFFSNKTILKSVTSEDIVGTYVNAFVFDFSTKSTYKGVFVYEETVTNNGKRETVEETKHVSGTYEKVYKNITVEANSNLDQEDLASIMPFDYSKMVKFNPDFMSNYMLEYQDKMFDECVENAKDIIKQKMKYELLRKHHCDRVRSLDIDTKYPIERYNYCLLPVYFVNAKKKDKQYKIVMNAQNGEVGNLPKNWWLTILSLFLVSGLIIGFLFFIFLLR